MNLLKWLSGKRGRTFAEARSSADDYTYKSTQATNCAGCGKHKHTPLRNDEMGGYVCLTCIDKELTRLQAASPPNGSKLRSDEWKDVPVALRERAFFSSQVESVRALHYGYWKQGQDPDVLDAFPAQRFIRVLDVKEPRDLHAQYEDGVLEDET